MKLYRFADGISVSEIEIKKSKFITSVKGEVSVESAKEFVAEVAKKHFGATHNCYAYITGINGDTAKFSDDGEPSGTAGQPMLSVLKKRGITNTVVVVTRYFGGIKLGAGGLLAAYSNAVLNALNEAEISTKVECAVYEVALSYQSFAAIEGYLKKNAEIISVDYGEEIRVCAAFELDFADKSAEELVNLCGGKVDIRYVNTRFVKLTNQNLNDI